MTELLELKKIIAYQTSIIIGLTSQVEILKAELVQEKKGKEIYHE